MLNVTPHFTRPPATAGPRILAATFVLAAAALPGAGQSGVPGSGTAAQPLPSAPSTLLAENSQTLERAPGSGVSFHGGGTETGPGGAVIERPSAGPLRLSLDDAISLGLERNIRLKYERANGREVKGDELGVVNALLPSLTFDAKSSAQELNLTALGFKPSALAGLSGAFGINPADFPTIIKVNSTQVEISVQQELFDLPAYELYRGSKREAAVVNFENADSRSDLVLTAGTAYLRVLADQSEVADARAQEGPARTVLSQAVARRDAGVGTNLDAVRAQVDLQQREQRSIAAENTLGKDIIQLNRILGLPAGQQLELTDNAPFNSLADLDLDRARTAAYLHRQDLLSLQAQVDVADRELRAARFGRLPTLALSGFYGVLGVTNGLYHGVFDAQGSLKFPIFREAAQRGEEESIDAQLRSLRDRETSLRSDIDQQIRASMLDIAADRELVSVAQSNVELANQELSDERDRFTAGVDDNLPVVDAEASVSGAETQLVRALFQYNVAKLQLARNLGLIELRYRAYLGPLTAAAGPGPSPAGTSSAPGNSPVLGAPAPATTAPPADTPDTPDTPIVAPADPFLPPGVPSGATPAAPVVPAPPVLPGQPPAR